MEIVKNWELVVLCALHYYRRRCIDGSTVDRCIQHSDVMDDGFKKVTVILMCYIPAS